VKIFKISLVTILARIVAGEHRSRNIGGHNNITADGGAGGKEGSDTGPDQDQDAQKLNSPIFHALANSPFLDIQVPENDPCERRLNSSGCWL
jgi:hypothetical protein